MTAGGVQAFLKSEMLLPGRRFVLAGGHPLLLVVADQLLHAGAELAAVVFAQPRPRLADGAAAALRLGGRVAPVLELAGPLRRLRRHGVPLLFAHLVSGAEGSGTLEAVTLTTGRPRLAPPLRRRGCASPATRSRSATASSPRASSRARPAAPSAGSRRREAG